MEPSTFNETRRGCGQIAVATALLLGSVWSAPLLAAANAAPDCDRLARGLKNLETPAEVLNVTAVDHAATAEVAATNDDTDELTINIGDSATPLLYLSPRVASLSRNVFEAGRESLAPNSAPSSLHSSPVAEADKANVTRDEIEDSNSMSPEEKLELPLFQREMYRTDI